MRKEGNGLEEIKMSAAVVAFLLLSSGIDILTSGFLPEQFGRWQYSFQVIRNTKENKILVAVFIRADCSPLAGDVWPECWCGGSQCVAKQYCSSS